MNNGTPHLKEARESVERFPSELLGVELQVRRELARRVVSLQQDRVLDVILERSFGWGQFGLKVPSQAFLAELSGMKEEHVCVVVKELTSAWVLAVWRETEFVEYRVNVESRGWGLERRPDLRSLDEELQRFNRVEQVLLLPREKSLREVATEVAVDGLRSRVEESSAGVRFSLAKKGGEALQQQRPTKDSGPAQAVTESVTRRTLINTDKSGSITSSSASARSCLITSDLSKKMGGSNCRRDGGSTLPGGAVKRMDWELLNAIKALIPKEKWEDNPQRGFKGWGGWWTSVVRNNRDRAEAALNELKAMRKEGHAITNAGGWMMDYVKRLAEE
jgi:hypothetical protein